MEHNIVNISLGENCLMDALLSKYGIKQESYAFGSTLEHTISWAIKVQSNQGVPLIVANFPRAVKIDKESDLTIIIRYDT